MQSSWQRDGSPDTTITASVAATPRRILVNVRGSLTRAGVPAHPSRRVPVDRSRAHRTCRSALRELGLRRRQRAVEAYAADEPCKTALHSGAAGPGHGELARVPDAAPGESFAVRECAANPGGPTRVHFGCTRSPSAVVSGRLTSPRNWRFAALLTTGDDCRLPLTFSDKEEVPGSSPGSPTPRKCLQSKIFPFALSPGSGRPAWWRCRACGHEWQARIESRTKHGTGCPACFAASGRRLSAPTANSCPSGTPPATRTQTHRPLDRRLTNASGGAARRAVMNGKQAQPPVADDPTGAVRAAPYRGEPHSPEGSSLGNRATWSRL